MRVNAKDIRLTVKADDRDFDIDVRNFSFSNEERDAQHVEEVLSELGEDGETDPARMSQRRLKSYIQASIANKLQGFLGIKITRQTASWAEDVVRREMGWLVRNGVIQNFQAYRSSSDELQVNVQLHHTVQVVSMVVKIA